MSRTMSFTSYLINMGIDAVLGIVGLGLIFGGLMMFFRMETLIGSLMIVVGLLPILYTRYRKKELGITY